MGKKILFSAGILIAYFFALYFSDKIPNNSISTLLGGVLTILGTVALLKVWVKKLDDKTWVEASNEWLSFLQATLVVSVFVLFIYHGHLKSIARFFLPTNITIKGSVKDRAHSVPLADCKVMVKFIGSTKPFYGATDPEGIITKTWPVDDEALYNQAIVTIKKEGCEEKSFLGTIDGSVLDFGQRSVECK